MVFNLPSIYTLVLYWNYIKSHPQIFYKYIKKRNRNKSINRRVSLSCVQAGMSPSLRNANVEQKVQKYNLTLFIKLHFNSIILSLSRKGLQPFIHQNFRTCSRQGMRAPVGLTAAHVCASDLKNA